MRIEFQDLIASAETLANGLYALDNLLQLAEEQENAEPVPGLEDLVRVFCIASRQHSKAVQFVLGYTERENR